MSQFNGVFTNLPGVSCDRFTGVNLMADQYFLSHCHTDHMIGLDQLVPILKRRNSVKVNHRIYCSSISKTFLVKKFKELEERYITILQPNEPVVINIYDRAKKDMYKLKVTTIPANHCPGSVMFLFEFGEDKILQNILYTGDFRFENQNLETLQALHDVDGNLININELYLDTTFCSPNYREFPTRDEAINRIWDLVHGWIRKNGMYRNKLAKHIVLFHLPAQYGSEAILRNIYEQSSNKWKIHVSERKFHEYLCTDDLGACTHSDPNVAQWIHACSWNRNSNEKKSPGSISCQDGNFEICHIRPSAMYFKTSRLKRSEDKVIKCIGDKSYRVCYSSHSSLTELQHFVNYIKPNLIFPCALPKGMTHQDVLSLLESNLDTNNKCVTLRRSTTSIFEDPGSVKLVTNLEGMSDVGGYVPEKTELIGREKSNNNLSEDTQKVFDNSNMMLNISKEQVEFNRKRMFSLNTQSEHQHDIPKKFDADSTDDDEDSNTCATKKRKCFRQSSKGFRMYSMPASNLNINVQNKNAHLYNNRASLPHNMKVPEIKITPSSPCLDPNDPDYPEFHEGKLYLESKNSLLLEGSNDLNSKVSIRDAEKIYSSESTKESTVEFLQETPKKSIKSFDTIELLSDSEMSHSDCEELQSTPELDVVISKVKNETELKNCLKFAKNESKRSIPFYQKDKFQGTSDLRMVTEHGEDLIDNANRVKIINEELERTISLT